MAMHVDKYSTFGEIAGNSAVYVIRSVGRTISSPVPVHDITPPRLKNSEQTLDSFRGK